MSLVAVSEQNNNNIWWVDYLDKRKAARKHVSFQLDNAERDFPINKIVVQVGMDNSMERVACKQNNYEMKQLSKTVDNFLKCLKSN